MTSINNGTMPAEWKIHKIIPVYKSGDKTSTSNYRPISLHCITSKLLERLIYNKIINTVSNSITPHQYGFQRGSSTLQQLIVYFHQLITSKEEIDVVYVFVRPLTVCLTMIYWSSYGIWVYLVVYGDGLRFI